MHPPPGPVSIVIKAYNEEARIGLCLASALTALERVGGEVVLADSGSSDATVTLADGTNAGLMAPAQHTKLAGIAIKLVGDGLGDGQPAATLLCQ